MSLVTIIENTNSWDDIYTNFIAKHQVNLSLAGKEFEQFAKLYFLCEPSVRDEYKHIWLFKEAPLNVKQKLGLGHQDYGIDLILEDHEGRLAVVQCKFKQDQSAAVSWSKDKLANMLADGDKADFFIIFTNASRIDTHTLSKKQNKLKVFTFGDLIHVLPETIKAMASLLLGQQPKVLPKKIPRDYQTIAIDKSVEGLENNDRGQLILPCGTGKTLISLWIHERLNPNYTLVLFPSLALLRQTKNEWAANRQQFVPYICVCSEKDIDKGDSAKVQLCELSGNVSTDPQEIWAYLIKYPQVIVFSTYQSLSVVAEAIQGTDIEFDLALCDEAHKTAGSKRGMYGFVHDNSNIQVKKRLYMTATPRILGDNAKKQLNDEELTYIADMGDLKTFGTEFHHMNFKDAIEQGILVDYKIIAMGVSDAEIAAVIKERTYVNDGVTVEELANNYALEKFMTNYNSGHAITFHSSVKKAQGFQERHQDLFKDIEAFHVNGKQTTNERSVTLTAFANSLKSVVTNARCLTEGVDVPAIDAVYFCDPKNSKIDIVQAAGRALRRADHLGKQLGYIVVPIFHRNRDNLEEAIEEGVFNNLVSVARAISAHDERLVDEIRKIKLGNGEHPTKSKHLAFEGAINLIQLVDMADLTESFFDQVISKIPLPWISFEDAKAFVHTLDLKNQSDWRAYCNSGNRPSYIPAAPHLTYDAEGWIGLGDWLGTDRIANFLKEFRSFEDARAFASGLNLKSYKEWSVYCKSGNKPGDIPAFPKRSYKKEGWISWGDWLGTKNRKGGWRPFEEARAFVRSVYLKDSNQWKEYSKSGNKPEDIPAYPNNVYNTKGWKSWGDWLGTGNIKLEKRSFEEARSFVRSLNIRGQKDWKIYNKSGEKPDDIPTNPNRSYQTEGWKSFGDWLGTGTIAGRLKKYRPFKEARLFVHSLNIKSQKDWVQYSKSGNKPDDIPTNPSRFYKTEGWKSFGDWLGTGTIAGRLKKYRPFEEALAFVHSLKIRNQKQWREYCKNGTKPDDIPSNPYTVYNGKGWKSFGDWLGTDRIASFLKEFRSFEDARAFVHGFNMKGEKYWRIYCNSENKPKDIPRNPHRVYKNKGWISWGDWLRNSK